jgi:hypothetical protein
MYHAWGRQGMHIGFWWENQKERDHYGDLDVHGMIILIFIPLISPPSSGTGTVVQ